jgi:hypothetical protein
MRLAGRWPPQKYKIRSEMLEQKLRELADLNRVADDNYADVLELEDQLKKTQQYSLLEGAKEIYQDTKDKITSLRSEINTLTVAAYQQTGDKKPTPGVGIRVGKSYIYDDEVAFDYCRSELPQALKLDKRTFEKFVKGTQDVKPLDFVTTEDKITPTIASDLSEYLE